MAYTNIFGRYLIIAVVIAAVIGAFSTLAGLYLSNRLVVQKESSTKETPDGQPELKVYDQKIEKLSFWKILQSWMTMF